jgi:hypothetical protein
VFFLRDWSLTLYLFPFLLVKPSYLFILLFLVSGLADVRLQAACKRLATIASAPHAHEASEIRSVGLDVIFILVLIASISGAAFGFPAAIYPTALLLAASAVLTIYNPRFRFNVHKYPQTVLPYKYPGQRGLPYPGGAIVGPLSLIACAEAIRIASAIMTIAGSDRLIIPGSERIALLLAAALAASVVVLLYHVGGFLAALDDRLRASEAKESE